MSVRIIHGDVREELPKLPADYFDCIVSSPPYYGLRDYGTATWEGGDPSCDHRQQLGGEGNASGKQNTSAGTQTRQFRNQCGKCGARRIDAQIGLEPTLDAYLETMVAVCRELRRVLKPSGVMFLNIGDSYAGAGTVGTARAGNPDKNKGNSNRNGLGAIAGLKPKDLCLVPQRLGIALQADGWWVRSHIIWRKPNPMPESVTDRPTSAHETIWMLTKNERYYWDARAVAEAVCGAPDMKQRRHGNSETVQGSGSGYRVGGTETRNIRNVWTMATQPFAEAHFATFPPELAERCIKAACPAGGHVLDPFGGAGTTGLVADRLGRDCTLIELNPTYADMARGRIKGDAPLFAEVAE